MMKFLWLALVLSFTAQASINDVEVIRHKKLSLRGGIELLRHHLEESRYLSRTQTFAFESTQADANYKNGDFVILWGVGSSTTDQTITETEYKGLWRVMNYLSQKDFRVILNVRSTSTDLADAFASKTASVVVFSAHGNQTAFYDFNHIPVPKDIFTKRSANVYQFILSACYGSIALKANYVVPGDLKVYSWGDLTNSTELLDFLVSANWTGLEGKPAGI
ncbi:MAG: hypothetical protein H0V66_09465 [Bdellovibrionales bacterium]|nr:hypothetical protein [Bdellovibrionales bacterium]